MDFNISEISTAIANANQVINKAQKTAQINYNKEFDKIVDRKEKNEIMTAKTLDNLYSQVQKAVSKIMNNMEQNIFLRDMLGFPKDWVSLLNEFIADGNNAQIKNILQNLNNANKSDIQNSLIALLNTNAKVDLAALAQQLQINYSLMADKLLKHMGTLRSQADISQLKSIMLIGHSIANNANINPEIFLRDMLQMYLPWLPLVPPKEEDFTEIEGHTTPKTNENSQVLFYMSTDYIGYFQVEIFFDNDTSVYIKQVRNKKNTELSDALNKVINEGVKQSSVNAKIYFSSKVDTDEQTVKGKQLFIVNSTDSMVGLTLIQLISRLIFEFDEKQGARFEKI